MKKVFNKALCAVLLLSLVFSSFSLIPSTVSADNSYTYEEETEVDISMDAENWVKTSAVDDDNFKLTTVTNSLDGSKYLNMKNISAATTTLGHTWVPYENAETKAQFDVTKVTRFEVTGIYNSFYGYVPFGYRPSDNRIFTMNFNQNNLPNPNGMRGWNAGEGDGIGWNNSLSFTETNPKYDYTQVKTADTIKVVFEADSVVNAIGITQPCVRGSFYRVVEGNDELMFTMLHKEQDYVYPSIGAMVNSGNFNINIYSMKVTYKKTVDATADVEKIASKYSTLTSLSSIADITKANAATVINEINNFTAEFKTLDSKLQSILVNADVYNADRFSAYKSYAQNLINGVIGQYFDTDVSSGNKADDLWSARGVNNITVADGALKLNTINHQFGLTNGLSTAPKSLVIKTKFADNTNLNNSGVNLSAGLAFKYGQKAYNTTTGAYSDNTQFWISIPAYKSDDGNKLIAKSISGNAIRGQNMRINTTDTASWMDTKVSYPEGDNAIVIGTYDSEGNYSASIVTVKIDYVLNADKTKYELKFTVTDEKGNSATKATGLYIPNSESVTDYSLVVSSLTYTNNYENVSGLASNGGYCTKTNNGSFGEIESIEYLMAGSDITAPTLDGVRFKDIAKGEADIAFQISSNASKAPEGYTPVAYGAYIITNAKLNGAYDIINADYTGKGGLKAIQAQKEVSDGKVPDTYLVSVAKSAAVSGETSFRGYRFAAVGYITYADESGNTVTVYTGNTTENTNVVLGQGNRSVVGVAKVIAATEIKNGAADTDNAISTIINKTTATTVAEQDTLIKFVCDNQSFIKQ